MQQFDFPGSNSVARDSKYRIVHGSDGKPEIQIEYYISEEVFYRPSTRAHPGLIAAVQAVKGYDYGSFIINEWSQILVGRVDGPPVYAGVYEALLEFEVTGAIVSADPPAGLNAGDPWPGPGVGRGYVLAAGAEDIYYLHTVEGATRKVWLSRSVGEAAARQLSRRLGRTKGSQGGRIYINERRQFFDPGEGRKDRIYLGALGDDAWFPKPTTD